MHGIFFSKRSENTTWLLDGLGQLAFLGETFLDSVGEPKS
jgi:hypothetical protein